MKKILITGSRGKIGGIITARLSKSNEVIGLDLPEGDISDYEFLLQKMQGVDIVIHVTQSRPQYENRRENPRIGKIDPVNVLLEMNVFTAAIKAKVPRLIMASSVHADSFEEYKGNELLTVPGSYKPTSLYGGHKLIIEEMGRFYAKHYNLEFIGIRFGGVTEDNSVKTFGKEREVWLSHNDLANAVEACVNAETVPDAYAVFYAVSNNDGRIHDTKNPFGWEPKDNSKDHL